MDHPRLEDSGASGPAAFIHPQKARPKTATMRPRAGGGFGSSNSRSFTATPAAGVGPGAYNVWSSERNASPLNALSRPPPVETSPPRNARASAGLQVPIAGVASDARPATAHRDHSSRPLDDARRDAHHGSDIARKARELNALSRVRIGDEDDGAGTVTVADVARAREEYARTLPDKGPQPYTQPSYPAVAPYPGVAAHPGYDQFPPAGALGYSPFAGGGAAVAGAVVPVFDEDLVLEQARRNRLRGLPPPPNPYQQARQQAQPPSPAINQPGRSNWLRVQPTSDVPSRLARTADARDRPTSEGGSADDVMLLWYPDESSKPATAAEVDALESSVRKLVENLEVSAGSREKAVIRLFSQFPEGARSLRAGGITPDQFQQMLMELRVTWATPATARALFHRFDFDGNGTLRASELGAMLFKHNVEARTKVTMGRVREVLAARGASGISTVADTVRQFRIFDRDGSGAIDPDEFRRGMELCLRSTDIWPLSRADEDALFRTFDRNGDGRIAFEEFVRSLRANMKASRRDVVVRAFEKLCAVARVDARVGIRLSDIAQQYDAGRNPRVQAGTATRGEVLRVYLQGFDKDSDDLVTLDEFVEYYTWLSFCMLDDASFKRMVFHSLQLDDGDGEFVRPAEGWTK